jgi:hypothetical protein
LSPDPAPPSETQSASVAPHQSHRNCQAENDKPPRWKRRLVDDGLEWPGGVLVPTAPRRDPWLSGDDARSPVRPGRSARQRRELGPR